MKNIIWGISANSHDAALAVYSTTNNEFCENLLFASHSERFSGIKNDPHLCKEIVHYASKFGKPTKVIWYERPFKKTLRQLWAGQGWFNSENNVKEYLKKYDITAPISYVDHHYAHAAGGYYTSGFSDASVLCIDGIGEWETMTIWKCTGTKLKKIFTQSYPNSIGLWYSAMTQRVGLKPNEDEYILMGMAAYGDKTRFGTEILHEFFDVKNTVTNNRPTVKLNYNLHTGCKWWKPELTSEQDLFDIAAGTQWAYEQIFEMLVQWININLPSKNLVLSGGCALNCSANGIAKKYFNNVWIMPNPGDAGSAIGAVAAYLKRPISFNHTLLGYDILRPYPIDALVKELLSTGIAGVANGKAEFGPRALGNRSLLADPRGLDIRDRVNDIKQRQKFRPFAPAILAEYADQYFDGPVNEYMQYTALCRFPDQFPAICHADGTSRVQVVTKSSNPEFYKLLTKWNEVTGCPMLLNTSLNIKGQPIVNNERDASEFSIHYGIKVY